MALSKSLLKGQIPIGCQLCETDNKIHWRCIDCTLLICNTCKKVHLKLSKEHKIVDIKSIQLPTHCQLCETSTSTQWRCNQCDMFICETCKNVHLKLSKDHEIINIEDINDTGEGTAGEKSKIEFKVVKQFTVDKRNIHYIAVCPDGSLWLGSDYPSYVQHIKLSDDKVTVLSTFDIKTFSLAISPSGSTFIVEEGSKSVLKIIIEKTGQLIDTKFTVHPLILSCIHVTRENNIILGGHKRDKGCVIMMDQNGEELVRYENDKDKPILTYPRRIATTRNGNIFITDIRLGSNKGRVVRIRPGDRDIMFYKGHSDINSDDKPFKPASILVTPRDNVLIRNTNTDYLHILNNEGNFITHFNLTDIGVIRPFSMALSQSGNVYVGGVSDVRSPPDYKATLYELKYSGI